MPALEYSMQASSSAVYLVISQTTEYPVHKKLEQVFLFLSRKAGHVCITEKRNNFDNSVPPHKS